MRQSFDFAKLKQSKDWFWSPKKWPGHVTQGAQLLNMSEEQPPLDLMLQKMNAMSDAVSQLTRQVESLIKGAQHLRGH